MATAFAIVRQKTHNIAFESRTLCYPWHPWYGKSILTRRAGGARFESAYHCKLPESPPDVMLVELPKWMFDSAECSTMRLAECPRVDVLALRSVAQLILDHDVSRTTSASESADPGDKNESAVKTTVTETDDAVRRKTPAIRMARSDRDHKGRCDQEPREAANDCLAGSGEATPDGSGGRR